MLDRAAAGGFNTYLLMFFLMVKAILIVRLAPKTASLADPEFDPLAYLLPAAHQRNLGVHVWFVVGPADTEEGQPGAILTAHPEWAGVRI